uniref:Uncharacterized protein n=1 Tax=Mycena chlorophos TaxID=658473 RepID=A0ABQ0LR73_MYCCL|nr:predicted protein [Mycena chlorophos]
MVRDENKAMKDETLEAHHDHDLIPPCSQPALPIASFPHLRGQSRRATNSSSAVWSWLLPLITIIHLLLAPLLNESRVRGFPSRKLRWHDLATTPTWPTVFVDIFIGYRRPVLFAPSF